MGYLSTEEGLLTLALFNAYSNMLFSIERVNEAR